MKKILSIILILTMIFSLTACAKSESSSDISSAIVGESSESAAGSDKNQTDKTAINVAVLKGPTGIGAVKLMDEENSGYNFTIAGAPEEIVGKITSGEIDIAAVPTNLAATLYNKTEGGIKLIAINTLGVLSILTTDDSVNNLSDSKGKKIYASGQGSTPEYLLNYILKLNNLSDTEIEYKSEHSEIAALLTSSDEPVTALLPEPFVTSAMMKNSGIKIVFDLSDEWSKLTDNAPLAMGALIVRSDFLDNNKGAVDLFLEKYKLSAEFVNNNIDEASVLTEKFDIMPSAVSKSAIPRCNIVCIAGDDVSKYTAPLLQIFFDENPKSVGGKIPDERFYYSK